MTTLAIRDDQTWWTEEQAAVLRQAGIDDDVTKGALQAFLHLCQRTQLDPFARQIYLVGRYDSRARRKVYTPQTGIDGYRLIAQRTCERMEQALSYDDALWCGPDGAWVDVWLDDGPPRAAKVTVYRDTSRFSAVAKWDEYAITKVDKESGEITASGLWGKMPAAMLAKCAEALALRKAFPNDMAGIYTAEEMQQADHSHGKPALARADDFKPDQAHQELVADVLDQRKDGKARANARRAERSQPTEPEPDAWSTPAQAGDPALAVDPTLPEEVTS
jgi:phage recombination protein Bet